MKDLKEINVDDLNGMSPANFKIITLTIQDVNPINFSEQCEARLKLINPEALVCYNTNSQTINTPRGQALVFIAIIQFWGTEEEHKQWLDEIKRNNLFIKP